MNIPTVSDKRHHYWRAVDQHGVVLDMLVQRRRSKDAATRFFKKVLSTGDMSRAW